MDDQNARLEAERMSGRAHEQVSGRAPEGAPPPAPRVQAPAAPAGSQAYVPERPGYSRTTSARPVEIEVPPAAAAVENSDDSARTRQIRSEIEQTREAMSETVNAIQDRLRPATIAATAADSVRSSAQNFADSPGIRYVREYPLPAAALACGVAGLAWLAMSSRGALHGDGGARSARYPSGPSGRSRAGSRGVDDAGQQFQASSSTLEDLGAPMRHPPAGDVPSKPNRDNSPFRRSVKRADPRDYRFMIGAAVAAVGAAAAVTLAGPERARTWLGHLRDDAVESIEAARRNLRARAAVMTDAAPTTTQYEADLPAGMMPDTVVTTAVIIERPVS